MIWWVGLADTEDGDTVPQVFRVFRTVEDLAAGLRLSVADAQDLWDRVRAGGLVPWRPRNGYATDLRWRDPSPSA